MSEASTNLQPLMHELAWHAGEELRAKKGLPNDQSNGNRCDTLTFDVMEALQTRRLLVRRELHIDAQANWHYLLAHESPEIEPNDDDIISDLNPWQWRAYGGPILHGPRQEVIEKLEAVSAPEFVVALRGVASIHIPHDTQKYPVGLLPH